MAVLLLGVVCSRSTHAAVFDPAKSYRTIKTPHFAIHYAGELEAVARRAAGLVEEVHGVLTPQYRWKPRGRTQVVLMDNNDDANGAAAVVPYNWLLLRVTAPEAGNALATYDDWLRTLIMHEYTHILHMDQTGGIMALPRFLLGKIVAPNGLQPAWMREGLAVHEETQESTGGRGRASFSEMMLRTAALHDRLLKITQADGFGWRWPAANAQYIYGGKFVEWLAAKYGEEKLLRYHRRVGRSPLLFMVNHQAKRIWKKSLSTLWREWQQELKDKYAAERAAIEGKGLTALQPLSQAAPGLSAPVVSRDGAQLAYTAVDYHRHPEIRVRDLATGADRVVRKKQVATQLSFSPDGEQLAYSAAGAHKNFSFVQDIYLLHLKTQKLSRLTAGRRAFDPDFSPDGKQLVYVVNNAGTQQLMVYDLATRSETALPIPAEVTTQYANPRWAPDGKSIAVSSWRLGGYRDILVVRPSGTVLKELTHDRALDNSPAWSRDGRRIYFMSDRSGVPNIYRYDLATGRLHQVTNVLTGVFEPTITPDEKTLVVQHYTGAGYDLRKVDLTTVRGSMFEVRTPDPESRTADPESRTADPISKKYSPFTPSLLVPRFLSPNVLALDNGVLLSAVTGGADPLRWHNWIAGASYRTDAKHVGYFGSYYYNRYMPVFDLGVLNYAVNFGNLTFLHQDGTLRTVHLYEKRLRGSAGLSVPWKQHRFSLQYFMENRDNIPMLTAEERAALNLDRFAGISATYRWGKAERFPASISLENGRRLKMNFTMTDKLLGSNEPNEQQIFAGDYREYLRLPWLHHVLALRIGGGIAWGDRLVQGTFGLGGALGEGNLAGGESFYYFPLRGLPVSSLSRTRALLMSAEYRVPLLSPQRQLGRIPVYTNNLHAATFVDVGNAWNAGESTGTWGVGNFLVGAGLELRGDFIVGHGLPVTGRLGYGIIVANRDRLGTLTDPLLQTPVKNGMLVLQFGTSF